MNREWKPGDVAKTAQGTVALCHGTGRMIDQNGAPWSDTRFPENLRPLVVIDPEDREQVRALADAAFPEAQGNTNRLQAALRSLVAEPEPEEPTDDVLVRDSRGNLWEPLGDEQGWTSYGVSEQTSWSRIVREYGPLSIYRKEPER